ncbi:Crp/Fnr family transcriptional regulator [Aureibaculum marinum]|uniref:Crp/Fnr family transcriptional regulator n=1 Tax=Aureibaculum marinum TaxID=2487930 RepID=A0A3N4NWV9_9FLAO|nr:Crp/Fnr family transcriptional regulator [Aureibaculum marinum]RPD97496.1 Crp/Fnr family transcriptional regulator [Aureibaculum marinum]
MIKEKLTSYFNIVFEEELVNEIIKVGIYKRVKENDLLLDLGDKFDKIPLILSGAIKISHEDHNGDEIVLYYLEHGDTCTITFGSGLHGSKSEIRGVAEMDSEIIFIPVSKMDEWLAKYKSWRTFVIDSYNTRLSEMIEAIDTLAFMKMDERLFKYLSDKVKIMRNPILTTTHQQIAQDLNTSRVVISRLLKQLENEQKIKLFRNKIEVLEY